MVGSNRSRPCRQARVKAVLAYSKAGAAFVVQASSLPGRPFVNGYDRQEHRVQTWTI
ncbi:MAG: hypothetical protein M0Z50_02660 [Planctomycetia bacterium]|nr:hypothetical protein [Planctomycetia bacterium]